MAKRIARLALICGVGFAQVCYGQEAGQAPEPHTTADLKAGATPTRVPVLTRGDGRPPTYIPPVRLVSYEIATRTAPAKASVLRCNLQFETGQVLHERVTLSPEFARRVVARLSRIGEEGHIAEYAAPLNGQLTGHFPAVFDVSAVLDEFRSQPDLFCIRVLAEVEYQPRSQVTIQLSMIDEVLVSAAESLTGTTRPRSSEPSMLPSPLAVHRTVQQELHEQARRLLRARVERAHSASSDVVEKAYGRAVEFFDRVWSEWLSERPTVEGVLSRARGVVLYTPEFGRQELSPQVVRRVTTKKDTSKESERKRAWETFREEVSKHETAESLYTYLHNKVKLGASVPVPIGEVVATIGLNFESEWASCTQREAFSNLFRQIKSGEKGETWFRDRQRDLWEGENTHELKIPADAKIHFTSRLGSESSREVRVEDIVWGAPEWRQWQFAPI